MTLVANLVHYSDANKTGRSLDPSRIISCIYMLQFFHSDTESCFKDTEWDFLVRIVLAAAQSSFGGGQ